MARTKSAPKTMTGGVARKPAAIMRRPKKLSHDRAISMGEDALGDMPVTGGGVGRGPRRPSGY